MKRNCRNIIGIFLIIIISTIINKHQVYAQLTTIPEVEVIETEDDISITNCISDGKLPKPIQPIKKKQSYKRILVSKRTHFTEPNLDIDLIFAMQSIITFQVAIPHFFYSINSYSQALLKHNSLFYLF